jgi:hypothetical protein
MKSLKGIEANMRSSRNVYSIIVIGILVLNLVASMVAAYGSDNYELESAVDSRFDDLYNIEDDSNILKDIITKNIKHELELSVDYQIQNLIRGGRLYQRVLLKDGGIDCSPFGTEQPFLWHLLTVPGELTYISVNLENPTYVSSDLTPYRVPQFIGSNDIVLSRDWKGYLDNDIEADWKITRLSDTTVSGGFGTLYSLKIYPVEYRSSGLVQVYKTIKITYYTNQNHYWSESSADSSEQHKPTGTVKYLIITHPSLLKVVEPFAEWKSQKGIFTRIVTTKEINDLYDSGDLQLKMRTYIQKMEQTYDLDYLLLIGDWDKVPTRNTKNSYAQPMMGEPDNFASDLYYACVDKSTTWNKDGDSEWAEDGELDDAVPDMANGRLAINSPSVVSSVLKNLMDRERNPSWDPKMDEAVYTCGDPGYMPGNPTDVMDYFWMTYGQKVFAANVTIYYDESGKLTYSSDSFKDVMDDRHQAMCYFGHGQPTGFPELFGNNDIGKLLTNGTDGSIFAMACLTSWFDDPKNGSQMGAIDNCFAEVLTETPNKGVVGYIGSSRMAVGYIDTTYSADAPGLEEDYWRAIQKAAVGNLTANIGSIWRDSITSFVGSFYPFTVQSGFDNPGQRTFLEYNLLGEPDAPLIFREPQQLDLQYELLSAKTTLWAKVTNSTGDPVVNADVCIYRAGELGRVYKTNAKGEISVSIPPNNGGVINITASRTGDMPDNDTFRLPDNLAPKPEYSTNPDAPDGNNGYFLTNPIISMFGDEPVDVEYKVDDGETIYKRSSASVEIPNGEHTVKFRVVDRQGHWSEWITVSFNIDSTSPELTISVDPAEPNGNSGWYTTKPKVALSSNEPLNESFYSIDSGEINQYTAPVQLPEGVHEVYFKATDLAGNINEIMATLKVDLTAPSSELNISHPPDAENEYYFNAPELKLSSPTDSEATFEYRWDSGSWNQYTGPVTAPEGDHTFHYRGIDVAGNAESENTDTFMVDTEAPEVSVNVFPADPDGENGHYITLPYVEMDSPDGKVTLYYYLADASTSTNEKIDWTEIKAQPYDDIISVPEGDWWLHVQAVDLAGNQGEHEPVYIKVDMTSPTLEWTIKPERPNGGNDWYKNELEIELFSDSEGAEFYWKLDENDDWNQYNDRIALTSGVHNILLKVKDLAGNYYETEITGIKVDTSPPEVNIITPVEGQTVGSTMLVTWSGMDSDSGMIMYKVRLDQKAWINMDWETSLEFDNLNSGVHKVSLKAEDTAGNNMVVKRSFTVDATAPKITSKTPVGQGISVISRIQITFSEEMQKESVDITIEGFSGTMVWFENTLIFTPNQKLDHSTRYVVEVTGMDQYNNSVGDYQWDFQTEPEPETSDSDADQTILWVSITAGVIGATVTVLMVVLFKRKKVNK